MEQIMSAHRVITTLFGIEALRDGTIILDGIGDVGEKYNGLWSFTNWADETYKDADIELPTRVLLESWER
jgi:hypothetical protein